MTIMGAIPSKESCLLERGFLTPSKNTVAAAMLAARKWLIR